MKLCQVCEEQEQMCKGLCNNCYHRKYRKRSSYQKDRRERLKRIWNDFFKQIYGKTLKCQVCGKNLNWEGPRNSVVCWDHRNGHGLYSKKSGPSEFRNLSFSEKNKNAFLKENYGVLCVRCNMRLPTENRKDWMRKAVIYVFGGNHAIENPMS